MGYVSIVAFSPRHLSTTRPVCNGRASIFFWRDSGATMFTDFYGIYAHLARPVLAAVHICRGKTIYRGSERYKSVFFFFLRFLCQYCCTTRTVSTFSCCRKNCKYSYCCQNRVRHYFTVE